MVLIKAFIDIYIVLNSKLEKVNKSLLAFFIFSSFWITLLSLSGTLKSGFHLTDDHEIYRINDYIKNNGIWETIVFFVKNDLTIRLRTTYYIHRVLLTYFLGTNFFLWSINYLILAILTSYFLFQFCFKQGFKFIHSLLFPFLTLLGYQAAVWWRLAPCESMGMFLLSSALYLLILSIQKNNNKLLVCSVFIFTILCLIKESFLLLTPAYMLILVRLKYTTSPNNSFYDLVLENLKVLLLLLFIFFSGILMIKLFIGTNKIGYAGIDYSFSIQKVLSFIYDYFLTNSYAHLVIFGVFLFLQIKYNNQIFNINIMPQGFIFECFIFLIFIIPQFVLYQKSGLNERYLLPLNFGFAYFIIFLLNEISINQIPNKVSIATYFTLIIFLLWVSLRKDTWQTARMFVKEGIYTNKFINKIAEQEQKKDTILIVMNSAENYEWAISLKTILKSKFGYTNIYYNLIEDTTHKGFFLELDSIFKLKKSNEILNRLNGKYSSIGVLPNANKKAALNRIDSLYQIKPFEVGDFTVYKLNSKH
jgi:hypothetical protein